MTYVNDGVNEGLVVAYSDGAAELYYIDLQEETLSVGKLGNVGQATAIAAPYVTTNPPESSVISPSGMERRRFPRRRFPSPKVEVWRSL